MLHVTPQPEPADFDAEVRQKGLAHLKKAGIDINQPLPEGTQLQPYWRACLPALYESYQGICAYLAIHFERITGAGSVDHFVAKSARPEQAYEWSNYRLACSRMNSRKNDYDDVLDPFVIENGLFRLELISGHIYPNPELQSPLLDEVDTCIQRLKLDDEGCKEVRARHFSDYIQGFYTAEFLKQRSPFVWFEAHRQGLL
ncbi:hypothetical protein PU634_03745 [Oceanimonas pelagia]|uniref:TIGR02646 family protein n=1 Tax=Oceanimonas pelagia TaxID=3028314 RepID=A0AA50QCT9_9GAMM|nr:hypothetical protein [Oceanimonas pelagia]WMC11484.1 hypothetical protein PU634_03745 [Oceanimonas pelagia]